YQPVPEEDIDIVESALGYRFPEAYRRFVREPDIESIRRLPPLLWFVRHEGVGILDVNRFLRGTDYEPLPDRLVAFPSNDCGDYFCFDRDTGRVVYIDPDYTAEENLGCEDVVYESFEHWLDEHLRRTP